MNPNARVPRIDEDQLDQLAQLGVILIDDALSAEQLAELRSEAKNQLGSFRGAEIHSGAEPRVRSDRITWIDEQQARGAKFVDQLMQLATRFNQAFYSGVRRIEAHYAHYPSGSFYAAHLDNPHRQSNRVFSCVYYLHEHWEAGFGGELEIETTADFSLDLPGTKLTELGQLRIHPLPGRLVIFDSRLSHSVLLSHFDRLSITAWMRRDHALSTHCFQDTAKV